MRLRSFLLIAILVLGCLSLEAAVFTSRRVLPQTKDEDISSQVPDVKAKAPKIYGKKVEETAVYEEEEAVIEEILPAAAEEESEEPLSLITVEKESEEPIEEEPVIPEEPVIAEPLPEEEVAIIEEEPLLERRTVYALVALFSFLVCFGFAFALRAYIGAPLSLPLSMLVPLSLALFSAALSTLALGWSDIWCSYALLLLSFLILRKGSFR